MYTFLSLCLSEWIGSEQRKSIMLIDVYGGGDDDEEEEEDAVNL